jgi:hypothetical protein
MNVETLSLSGLLCGCGSNVSCGLRSSGLLVHCYGIGIGCFAPAEHRADAEVQTDQYHYQK